MLTFSSENEELKGHQELEVTYYLTQYGIAATLPTLTVYQDFYFILVEDPNEVRKLTYTVGDGELSFQFSMITLDPELEYEDVEVVLTLQSGQSLPSWIDSVVTDESVELTITQEPSESGQYVVYASLQWTFENEQQLTYTTQPVYLTVVVPETAFVSEVTASPPEFTELPGPYQFEYTKSYQFWLPELEDA